MRPHLPFCLLIALNILTGMLTFSRYGESWDVNSLSRYADSSLLRYTGLVGSANLLPVSSQDELALGNYGPAYMMLVNSIERLMYPQNDGPRPVQHILYFLTFQTGIIAFYLLALRWMKAIPALGATLLFATQPVLWGHAFINPKDIPFLAFFLWSLFLGFRMADSLQPVPLTRRLRLLLAVFWLIPFAVVFLGSSPVLAWLERLIRSAAAGGPNIISWIASDIRTAAPDIYIRKYSSIYIQVAFCSLLFSLLALFVMLRHSLPVLLPTVLAAVVLGFTVAIRNLGLFAGMIVALYVLWKHRRQALVHLLVYGVITAASIYLFWPYLWTNPIGRLVESIFVMSRYPWNGVVLFRGTQYPSTALPVSYLPTLLGIQLTEPVWVVFLLGLAAAVSGSRMRRDLIALLAIWFFIPLLSFMTLRTVLYDNFRQVLFILPPVFIVSGLTFEKIRRPAAQAAVIVLLVLPGIIGIGKLYPYEYVYYNSLVGGTDGAFRKFELDYWGTSYREAAAFVNTTAPERATVWAEGPAHLFTLYARPDLKVYSTGEVERADHYEYVVATSRYNLDQIAFPDAKVVYSVRRGRAVLAVVKEP